MKAEHEFLKKRISLPFFHPQTLFKTNKQAHKNTCYWKIMRNSIPKPTAFRRNGEKTQPPNKNKKPSIHSHQTGISSKPLPLTEDMQVGKGAKSSPTTWHFLYLGPSNPGCWEDTDLGRRSLSEARRKESSHPLIGVQWSCLRECLSSIRMVGGRGAGTEREWWENKKATDWLKHWTALTNHLS